MVRTSRGRPPAPKKEEPVDPIAALQGARLRLLHEEKERQEGRKITQGEIGNVIGASTEAYGSYERGRIRIPYEFLEPLSRYYGVSSMYLAGLSSERSLSADRPLGEKARLAAEYINQMSDAGQSFMITVAADQLKVDRQTRSPRAE